MENINIFDVLSRKGPLTVKDKLDLLKQMDCIRATLQESIRVREEGVSVLQSSLEAMHKQAAEVSAGLLDIRTSIDETRRQFAAVESYLKEVRDKWLIDVCNYPLKRYPVSGFRFPQRSGGMHDRDFDVACQRRRRARYR